MITTALLKSHTLKDLTEMAKERGLSGWRSMRKDQLVRALVRADKKKAEKSAAGAASAPSPAKKPGRPRAASQAARTSRAKSAEKSQDKAPKARTSKNARLARRIREINAQRKRFKDLSGPNGKRNGAASLQEVHSSAGDAQVVQGNANKDCLVLEARGPYWLQACWELTEQCVARARAAMSEQWHTAKPTLRLIEVEASAAGAVERVARDIEIHGAVNHWYIDVRDPRKGYRAAIGYLAATGKFFTIARSNSVGVSRAGGEAADQYSLGVAEPYEKTCARGGGGGAVDSEDNPRQTWEEHPRRPTEPAGVWFGAETVLYRRQGFRFEVDAEMIVYGATRPNARVTLAGQPVHLRPDGTFAVRVSMPNRRQVLPVVASSWDGGEQHTTLLAIERNTKVMEPIIHDCRGAPPEDPR